MRQRSDDTHGRLAPGLADPVLAAVALTLTAAVVAFAALAPDTLNSASTAALDWIVTAFGWYLVATVNWFVVVCAVLAISRFGLVKLGGDEDEPEFGNLAWAAMMFASGMGIGLMFYGVAEPLSHFTTPPPGTGVEPESDQAAQAALRWSVFHWTIHPWSVFAITGLALAYAVFRKGRDFRLSSIFERSLERRAWEAPVRRGIDVLTALATVFGSATSLGLGALQVAAGLQSMGAGDATTMLRVAVIAVMSIVFTISAFTGIHRGIRWLSTTNVVIAAVLLAFVLTVGPTLYVLDSLPAAVGSYLDRLPWMASRSGAHSDPEWLSQWTLFYWAWVLSWAPFVGTFIARISRGRSIRQFVVWVVLIPSAGCAVWFAVAGGSAVRLQQQGRADLLGDLEQGPETVLFAMLDALPLTELTSAVAIALVALYFVTGGDSASLVLGTLSNRGRHRPSRWIVATWGLLIGAVAAALVAAGGLAALQQAVVVAAFPFSFVMLAMVWVLLRELRDERIGPGLR